LRTVLARNIGEFGLEFGRRQVGHRVCGFGIEVRRDRRRFDAQCDRLVERFVKERRPNGVAPRVVSERIDVR